MKKKTTMMALYAGCMAVICACSENRELSDGFIDEPKELGVNPTMTLAMGTAREAASTTQFAENTEIAVLAVGSSGKSNYGSGNNYAVYKNETTDWTVQNDKHIYLTSEVATIYAVYPHTLVGSAPTGVVTADTEVEGITTFAGATDAIDTSNGSKNLITAEKNATNSVNIAPGETDYMYAGGKIQPTASNGKATDAPKSSVDLSMQHALAMVSFRVYKKADYKGAGHLTKIQMKNKGTLTGTPLKLQQSNSGQQTTMKIGGGDITLQGTAADITYTRFIHQKRDDEGDKYYELKVAGGSESSTATVPAFGIMLYPIACEDENATTSDIQVIFTVDDTEYPVDIPAAAWAKGTNSIYSATLAGEGLSLGTVTIAGWTDTTISNGLNLIEKPKS